MMQSVRTKGKLLLFISMFIVITGVTQACAQDEGSSKGSDVGIVGGAFHVVGEVLAFPFRVAGGIVDAIF